eukprot:snap_masked-scaffold_7-processed-gene-9.38-mRNA-1 protein AED:1.00 eAED:1.00 QI:0/0/0/0/1/1/2/0/62
MKEKPPQRSSHLPMNVLLCSLGMSKQVINVDGWVGSPKMHHTIYTGRWNAKISLLVADTYGD